MLFLCYKNCSTCKKASDFLRNFDLEFTSREITEFPPTISELNSWIDLSDKSIDKFFNTSGLVYKELNLKDKLSSMSKKEKIDLLSNNGMLVKRPMLVLKNKVLIGFKEAEWMEALEL